ncbi:hypothetical protein INR49_026432 [Caranx melampygus]|nr:hypothetical protein INR49_026432 [Caranx melampygus]
MRRTLLWLLASLAFASFISKADGTELKVMSAPNLLRVGTVENIFVECQDCKGGDITVNIFVMNHPTKKLRLTSTSVTLTSAQDFQGIGQIKIPAEEFSRDPTVKQYVYLQAQFPDKLLEKVVLVSFQSGYIFIQTDKTLYTPNSRLHYRMFALTPGMEPVERDETTDASIDIEIMTPEDITFPVDIVSLNSGIHSGYYQLPDIVSMGIWKVVAKFHSNPQQTFSAEFEVKEYVLPSFEVKLIPLSSFFYVDSETLTINIKAKYLFGEEVDGSAYVVFGVVHDDHKKSFPDSVQKVEIAEGEGEVILKREHITQSFNINDLVGNPIFVAVSVLTENGGEMVEAELRGIQIVTSPYSIVFKRTPKYFKPGMSFDVAVEVLNPDETPAEGVQVVVMPGEVRGLTAANGMAKVTVNTMNGAASLTVTARTDDPQISPERQASATMNALPYQTSGNNYIHIGVDTAELQLGNNLKISLNLNRRAGNDITYLILSRSQLVRYGRYTTQGQVLISLIVPITKDMLPSFRIIAYYHTDANEVVSDSVWVDVKDTCMGSLRLEPSRPAIYYEPRSMFGLTVTGDPGATVGLVAVDKGVYVLNNKYRLTQKKIWDLVEKYDTGCTPGGGKDSMGVFYDAGLLFESSSGSGTPYRQGICVSEPLEVTVRKDFFIDLRLPYSAVRGEQLEIKAILHNYSPKRVNVRVDLLEEEHVCSSASKRSKYRQEVKVASHSSRSVPFIIIPMKEGTVNVEVKAAVQDSHLHDGIRRLLRVVPEGELIKHPQTIILDPVNNGADGRQVEILNSGIQRRDLVPNTPMSTQISVTGMEQVGALVEDAISGQSMGNMIYQPSGCGEQNMIHMTMPVIATLYLDKTSQWETVGFQKRDEAIKHIMYGYQRELAYRKRDGSFAAFPERQSSTWLTAYVAKVFAMANSLVAVQKEVICGAVKFVILNGQQPDGMFKEGGPVIHGEMMGDIRGGQDSDVSMTAFCLIALQETRTLCSDTVNSLPASIVKAVTYLEKHLPNLKNPYAVAIASYALANEEKLDKDFLYRFVSSELNHWPVPRGHIYTIEATGYALLALVRAKALEEARPIVRWMSKQQRAGRGYGSTQATIIVYQAVAEYWVTAKEPEYNLNMVSLYYAIPKEKESDCQKFNLSVQLIPEKENDEEKVYRLKIEYFYKDEQRDAGMSILDIGLLTGFTADINDLNRLAKGPSRTISRYEMNTALSDRGSLIIYLKSASHTQTEEVAFRIRQTLKVGVLQPAAVSIYEYYDQKHCVKFYHPERRAGHLMRLCRNDECTCAEENCSLQKKEKVDNEQRIAKSCESTPTSKIDYVYKVRVENYTDGVSTDFYTMRVLESIKEGNLDVGPRGKLRIFLGYPHCREALDLRDGNTYLIMGTSQDIYRDNKLKTFQYVLGERTWVEYWPKDEECQSDEHRDTCVGMQKMVQVYTIKGCNE